MSRFCPLFSSSKGNSTYISCGETSLLIDAGVSYRQLERSMREQDLDIESISAVLITHEHSDHIRGIKSLIKKTGVPVFASKGTIDYLWLNDYIPSNALAIDCDTSFQIEDIVVIPFKRRMTL